MFTPFEGLGGLFKVLQTMGKKCLDQFFGNTSVRDEGVKRFHFMFRKIFWIDRF